MAPEKLDKNKVFLLLVILSVISISYDVDTNHILTTTLKNKIL
jgi:hypothetical protein